MAPAPLPLILCPSYLDTFWITLPLPGASWSFPMPIPNNTSLIGENAAIQTWYTPRSGPFDLRASNGVVLTFGM